MAHGQFHLQHTFKQYHIPQGTTNNLMDYADGAHLLKPQWDNIHTPELVFGIFQDDESGENQFVSDPVCTQKFLEQFRWAYVYGEKLEYEADGYPWIGHHANDLMLGDSEFEKIKVEVRQDLGFVPYKVNYKKHYGRVDVEFGKVLTITSENNFDQFQDYLYPSKEEYDKQVSGLIQKITSIEKNGDLLESLAILPSQEYKRFSSEEIVQIISKLARLFFMTEDWVSCVNTEEILVNIVKSCDDDAQKQLALLKILRQGNNLNHFINHLDGDYWKEFLFTCAKYEIQNTTPDINEVYRQNFNYMGDVYTKVFDWEETLSPDVIYESENLVRTGEFKVTTKNDWLSILQEGDYLAKFGAFEYIRVASKNAQEYLPKEFIPGESIVLIPAFLFHYILEQKHTEQLKEDIATLFDIGLTVATIGSYAAGKKTLEIAAKSIYAGMTDLLFQVTLTSIIDDIPLSQAVDSIDYRNVIWAAGAIHISSDKYAYILGCVRNGLKVTLKPDKKTIQDAILSGLGECVLDGVLTYFSVVSTTIESGVYKKVLEKFKLKPRFVTKRLLKYGIGKTIINNFKIGIKKESIRKEIDKAILEYEQEI